MSRKEETKPFESLDQGFSNFLRDAHLITNFNFHSLQINHLNIKLQNFINSPVFNTIYMKKKMNYICK